MTALLLSLSLMAGLCACGSSSAPAASSSSASSETISSSDDLKATSAASDAEEEAASGSLVIDYEAEITSSNGQTYTAATANDEDGNTYYTGDAPSCLADQKAAARFIQYNILLGNLPGCGDYLISTGGSDGAWGCIAYSNNLVELYNPLNYIGAEDTEDPAWVKILCGAAEGDISMFNSLNLQIAMLNAGIDATIEWQWDGGHVSSEVLGDSFSLYVDQMYGEYVAGAAAITKAAAAPQTANGTATEATGTDLTDWDSYENGEISFSLADAAAYRTAGASKAMPGFDVIDYGQEDYVFGAAEQDARHWDSVLLEIFETYADVLAPLFNSGSAQ